MNCVSHLKLHGKVFFSFREVRIREFDMFLISTTVLSCGDQVGDHNPSRIIFHSYTFGKAQTNPSQYHSRLIVFQKIQLSLSCMS